MQFEKLTKSGQTISQNCLVAFKNLMKAIKDCGYSGNSEAQQRMIIENNNMKSGLKSLAQIVTDFYALSNQEPKYAWKKNQVFVDFYMKMYNTVTFFTDKRELGFFVRENDIFSLGLKNALSMSQAKKIDQAPCALGDLQVPQGHSVVLPVSLLKEAAALVQNIVTASANCQDIIFQLLVGRANQLIEALME